MINRNGQYRLRKTTIGRKLLVLWKDGNEQWIPLNDPKESHPVDFAEFAVAKGIYKEPAFRWWVPYTLKKRDAIIATIRSRALKKRHKYGIEVPSDVDKANALDTKNGNNLWQKAIIIEMANNTVAFQILDDDEHLPVRYTKQSGHMVFDVKMNLTRKARLVLDGHKTPGDVSRESVRSTLTYAALNGVAVSVADIQNTYLQAPSSQTHYIICGPEFGLENIGKRVVMKRALYCGKTAGKDFRDHLRSCMRHIKFTSCLSDPDL